MATKGMETLDAASLQSLLGPELTAEQAALIFQQAQEAVVFALLTLANQLAEKLAIAATPDPSQAHYGLHARPVRRPSHRLGDPQDTRLGSVYHPVQDGENEEAGPTASR